MATSARSKLPTMARMSASVEAELHLGQAAVAVLGELDGAVSAGQRGLRIADESADGADLLVVRAGSAAAGRLAVNWRSSSGSESLYSSRVSSCMARHQRVSGSLLVSESENFSGVSELRTKTRPI